MNPAASPRWFSAMSYPFPSLHSSMTTEAPERNVMPRLAHSKSRLGCKRCKRRKVKCDEVRPSCKACLRHHVPCDYPKLLVKTKDQDGLAESSTVPHGLAKLRPAWPEDIDQPHDSHQQASHGFESLHASRPIGTPSQRTPLPLQKASIQDLKPTLTTSTSKSSLVLPAISPSTDNEEVRRFEMRLMHHFTVETSRTFPFYDKVLWGLTVPELGVQHGFLLDEILALSALHLSRKFADEKSYLDSSYKYFRHSLDSHLEALRNLNTETFEALLLTAIMISIQAFAAMGQGLEEPMQLRVMASWYHLTHSASNLRRHCVGWIRQSSRLRVMSNFDAEESIFASPHTGPFFGILRHQGDEQLAAEDMEAYERVLGYVSFMHNMVSSGRESSLTVMQRLVKLPAHCPARFEALVLQYRPRALVLVAHAIAVSLMMPCDSWWAQGLECQICYVYEFVPVLWKQLMAWPLEIMRNHISTRAIGKI